MSKRILTLALLFVFVLCYSAVGLAEPTDGEVAAPSVEPSVEPGEAVPTPEPTPDETAPAEPSEPAEPTEAPSSAPTAEPSDTPSSDPSEEPTVSPSTVPSQDPSTPTPSPEPSETPSPIPTEEPTPITYMIGLGLGNPAKVYVVSPDGERDDVTDDAAIIVEDGATLRLLVVPGDGYTVGTASFLDEALSAEKTAQGYLYTLKSIGQNGTFTVTIVKDTPASQTVPLSIRWTGSGTGSASIEITPDDGDVVKREVPEKNKTLSLDAAKDAILVVYMTPAKGSGIANLTVNGKSLTWTESSAGTYKSQPLKLTSAADMVVTFGAEVPVDVAISGSGTLSIFQNGAWKDITAGNDSFRVPEGATLTIRAKGTGSNVVDSFKANGATVRASSSTKEGSLYHVTVSGDKLTLRVAFAPHTNGLDSVPKTGDETHMPMFLLIAFLSGSVAVVCARRLARAAK